jgi:ribosomal protein L44E
MTKEKTTYEITIPVKCSNCKATALIDRTDPASGWTHTAKGKWYCPKCSH